MRREACVIGGQMLMRSPGPSLNTVGLEILSPPRLAGVGGILPGMGGQAFSGIANPIEASVSLRFWGECWVLY
jgi:hypothetical protein